MSIAARRLRHLSQRPIYAADSSHCASPGLSLSIQTNWPSAGRSVHWAICTGKREKNGVTSTVGATRRQMRWKNSRVRNSPAVLLWDFPADRKSLPAIGESRARTNKQSRTKREVPIVSPARFTKYRPLCGRKGKILSRSESILWYSITFLQTYFRIGSIQDSRRKEWRIL